MVGQRTYQGKGGDRSEEVPNVLIGMRQQMSPKAEPVTHHCGPRQVGICQLVGGVFDEDQKEYYE